MKKMFLLLSFLLLISCSKDNLMVAAETGTSETGKQAPIRNADIDPKALFNLNNVPSITLQFSEIEWNKLLTNYDLNPKNEKKVKANFSYVLNGQTTQLNNIGAKLRGNTSRRRPEGLTGQLHDAINPDWHHFHLALDFSKNIPDQRFAGRNKLDLKWFKDDAAYVREVYCYDLFRRFGVWTAPRASYCRVYIQVDGTALANYGVYAMIEHVDEDYIAARQMYWTSTIGDLWKAGYGSDGLNANFVQTTSMGEENVTLDPNTSVYYAYDLKTNSTNSEAAKANLTQFITDLNTKTGADFQNWITTKMDVPLFMKTYAVNVMVGMWDDYWVNANNFYFYFSGNGKAYFIPFDYDNTLGTSQLVNNSGTQNLLSWGPSNNRPLITKLLAVPAFQQMYKDAITQLRNTNNDLFAGSKSIPRIQTWQNKIIPYVSNDTGEDMSIQDIPAPWGNQPNYRLLSGNFLGNNSGNGNWFYTRAANISW